MPPSYSNRDSVDTHDNAHDTRPTNAHEHDVSWESEVSRADTSVLSHEVGDFAEADTHFELHGTDAEAEGLRQSRGLGEGQSLDGAGLTMGLMGFNHAQHPPSQPVPNQRYQDALRDSYEDNKRGADNVNDDEQHWRSSAVGGEHSYAPVAHNEPSIWRESQEQPHLPGTRQRSNSLNSASIVSTHSDRSSQRGSASKAQPNRIKYSGITDIKISHKLKPGDVVPARSAPSAAASAATRKISASTAARTLRTASPLNRLPSDSGTGKRDGSTPHARPTSSNAAVVTPGTGNSKGRLIGTGSGSVLKKTPKDKSLSGSGPRRQSLMY